MKFLKVFLGIFATLFVFWLIISAFLPSHVKFERSAVINAPPETVFQQVNTLKNWEKWSYWHQSDPEQKIAYSGPPAGTGASYAWDGEKTKQGTLTIIDASEP